MSGGASYQGYGASGNDNPAGGFDALQASLQARCSNPGATIAPAAEARRKELGQAQRRAISPSAKRLHQKAARRRGDALHRF
jgi:hypothetical protein